MEPPQQSPCSTSSRPSVSSGSSVELPYGNPAPAKAAPAGFLFVDSQVDNPQNHALKKEKQSFVLNKYFRKKRQAAIERIKPSTPAAGTRPRLGPRHRVAGKEGDESQQTSDNVDTITRHAAQSLTMYLSQGYTDPFTSVALEMSDPTYSYFYQFRVHTIPACYPLDATRISTYWWRQGITQPALLQSLLFLAAGHQASLQISSGNSSQGGLRQLRDSLRLRIDALKRLQNIIQDPISAVAESTVLAVATIATIEAVNANIPAVEAHMKGLKRLIKLMGGLELGNHMFLSKVYLSDVKSAALNNTPPIFPILPKWRSAIMRYPKMFQITGQEELKIPEALSNLGRSIFDAPWFLGLEPSMRTFFRVFFCLVIYYELAILAPELVMPTDNDLYILLEYQLLSTRYPLTTTTLATADDEDGINSQSPLNEPLRHTLLLYLNIRMWHLQPFPLMQHMSAALKESLLALSSNTSAPHLSTNTIAPDLLFWILFVGGLASQGYECHAWFVKGLSLTARVLELEDWTQARAVLGGFFYTDQPAQRRKEEALWSAVISNEG
ncbi:hypothetical protein BDW59DRAFT_154243 [Aspergillus cavernicola]|uniref:Fungal-specific transcription factor domain-containing protein n=1 Tax=Aspergillus cavernicola TaxID=176166 RepID=A0ABR4HGR1_9EURO